MQQIRREGLERSQVVRAFDQFVTVAGPRLTGSPAHQAAAEWARETLASWGLSNAHLEPWPFGRGWVLDLKQNAVSLAWFAYSAAMMSERFPR